MELSVGSLLLLLLSSTPKPPRLAAVQDMDGSLNPKTCH